jgi:hypothetical protein
MAGSRLLSSLLARRWTCYSLQFDIRQRTGPSPSSSPGRLPAAAARRPAGQASRFVTDPPRPRGSEPEQQPHRLTP